MLEWRWTNFIVVRKVLRNNHQSCNFIGHYPFLGPNSQTSAGTYSSTRYSLIPRPSVQYWESCWGSGNETKHDNAHPGVVSCPAHAASQRETVWWTKSNFLGLLEICSFSSHFQASIQSGNESKCSELLRSHMRTRLDISASVFTCAFIACHRVWLWTVLRYHWGEHLKMDRHTWPCQEPAVYRLWEWGISTLPASVPIQMYWTTIVDLEKCGKITLKNRWRDK